MKSYREVYQMVNELQKKAADQTKSIKATQNKEYINQVTDGGIPLTSDGGHLQGDVPLKAARQAQAKQVSKIYPRGSANKQELASKRRTATDTLRDLGKFKQDLTPQKLSRLQQALKDRDKHNLKRILQE